MPAPGSLLAALRLRSTVSRRRFASPLEGLLLLGLAWLSGHLGQELAERVPQPGPLLPAAFTLVFAILGVWLGALAAHLLYGARELVLLHANGMRASQLAALRAVELAALGGVLALPLATCQLGVLRARGGPLPPLCALLAWLGAALALAAAGLCGGWLAGRVRHGSRWLSLVGLLLLGAGGALVLSPALQAALSWGPSPGVLWRAALGGSPTAAVAILLGGALWWLLALALAATGQAPAVDRATVRATGSRRTLWVLLAWPARPLGRQAGALLQRDLAILLRGGFRRGLILLVVLPAALLVLRAIVQDTSLHLQRWQIQLAGLLVVGVLASAAGYLFGLDYPRARDQQRILERSNPLRPGAVMRSRWAPAALYALALALGATWILSGVAHAPPPLWFLLAAALEVLAITHDAAAFGLGAESSVDLDQAAGFPFRSGVLVLVLALGLTWNPLGILLYPLLGYVHAARAALRTWELAEVTPGQREGGA